MRCCLLIALLHTSICVYTHLLAYTGMHQRYQQAALLIALLHTSICVCTHLL
jgi:hypothetical protein